jgi:hypothetical protein
LPPSPPASIELDPNYAGPYAALAWAYIMDYQNRWSDSPETALDQAERLIDEAIEKDNNDPFVHYVASLLGLWKKDYERWAHEADTALSLNPNYGHARSIATSPSSAACFRMLAASVTSIATTVSLPLLSLANRCNSPAEAGSRHAAKTCQPSARY